MASILVTDTGPAQLIQDHFQDKLDTYLTNNLLAADLMDSMVLPANRGRLIDFHRLNTGGKQTIGLSSNDVAGHAFGSAHPSIHATAGQLKARTFTIDTVSAQLELIGNDMELTEYVIMTTNPNPVPALSRMFLYQSKDTLDQIYINKMVCSSLTGATNTLTVPSVTVGGSSRSVNVIWGDGSATLTEATLDADIPSHRIAAESFNSAEATLRSFSAKPRSGGLFDALISPEL